MIFVSQVYGHRCTVKYLSVMIMTKLSKTWLINLHNFSLTLNEKVRKELINVEVNKCNGTSNLPFRWWERSYMFCDDIFEVGEVMAVKIIVKPKA